MFEPAIFVCCESGTYGLVTVILVFDISVITNIKTRIITMLQFSIRTRLTCRQLSTVCNYDW